MRKMTKYSLIVFISFFCLQSNAQTFGIKGGLNLANLLEKDDDDTYSGNYKMKPGFHIGATIELPINDFLFFESGLFLTTKGMKWDDEMYGADFKSKTSLYYFDIPLTIKATYDLNENLKMFGAVGPYVGVGLVGKIKVVVEYQGEEETEKEDIKWGNDEDEDHLKRLDMGLTFGGGVEINSIYVIGISYDLGLANISSYQDDGVVTKNRVLKFSVGYRFGN